MRKFAIWFVSAVLITTTTITALADEIDDLEQRKSSIESQKADISRQKQNEQNKKNAVQKEAASLANEQSKAEKSLKVYADDLLTAKQQYQAIEKSVQEAEAKYKQQKDQFRKRVRLMYENSNISPLQTFLESKSISDFKAKLELMSLIAKKDKEAVQSIETAKKDLEFKKSAKEDEKAAIEKKTAEQKKIVASIQVSRSKKNDELSKINSTISMLDQQERELEQKSAEIANWIRSVKNKRAGGYTGGSMIWPAPSSTLITSPFGNRWHPVLRRNKYHTGIDIGAASGTNIVAANKGTVILAGWQDGYGNTVIIDHGGDIVTLYGHASKLLVSEGDEVEAGAVIAKVGSTGLSTGPHLHFEVRKNGDPVNPLDYVSAD